MTEISDLRYGSDILRRVFDELVNLLGFSGKNRDIDACGLDR